MPSIQRVSIVSLVVCLVFACCVSRVLCCLMFIVLSWKTPLLSQNKSRPETKLKWKHWFICVACCVQCLMFVCYRCHYIVCCVFCVLCCLLLFCSPCVLLSFVFCFVFCVVICFLSQTSQRCNRSANWYSNQFAMALSHTVVVKK